jgi:hypothetical protein
MVFLLARGGRVRVPLSVRRREQRLGVGVRVTTCTLWYTLADAARRIRRWQAQQKQQQQHTHASTTAERDDDDHDHDHGHDDHDHRAARVSEELRRMLDACPSDCDCTAAGDDDDDGDRERDRDRDGDGVRRHGRAALGRRRRRRVARLDAAVRDADADADAGDDDDDLAAHALGNSSNVELALRMLVDEFPRRATACWHVEPLAMYAQLFDVVRSTVEIGRELVRVCACGRLAACAR